MQTPRSGRRTCLPRRGERSTARTARLLLAFLCGLLAPCLPARGGAFTVHSLITDDCHESLTTDALRAAGWPAGWSPPPGTEQDRILADDLPFSAPSDDPWLTALLIGARSPDVDGLSEVKVDELAALHADPATQQDHCLRGPHDDGVQGDQAALLACRESIRESVRQALGEEDAPDPAALTEVKVALVFRGSISLQLPRFPFYAGRALHTLQDSYAHSFRSADERRVLAVLNFIDTLRSGYDPARDGPRHASRLDSCYSDAGRSGAAEAMEASVALLQALADPSAGRAGRLQRVEAVLDDRLGYEPGCTVNNDWCGRRLPSCSVVGLGRSPSPPRSGWLLLAGLLFLGRRKTLRRWALGAALAAPLHAAAAPLSVVAAAPSAGPLEPPPRSRFSIHGGLGGTVDVDHGAVAILAGGALRCNRYLSLGLSIEFNPWISFTTPRIAPGALNVYGSAILTWTRIGQVELHSVAQAGLSVLLFDLVAAEVGSPGVFLGLSVLGISIPVRKRLFLMVDPGTLVLTAPQLRGVPLMYPQHRLTIGMQWDL